ncbi:MAG TPA: hypothetical protein VK327_02420, partial [Candidatus Paceibacterota bacterium]|nr:hypothetical protein [Candidatus Paceibacterota bacterium]
MFENMVQTDFIHALERKVQLRDVGEYICADLRLAGMFGRRVINVYVSVKVVFAAAEVQAQRAIRTMDT